MGAEWWLRRSPSVDPETLGSQQASGLLEDVNGVVKARASTTNVGL